MLTSVLQKECEGCQSHLSRSLGAKLAPTPHRDTLAGRAPKNSGPAAQFLLVVIGSMLVWICRLATLQSVDVFAKGSFLKVNSTSQSISIFQHFKAKTKHDWILDLRPVAKKLYEQAYILHCNMSADLD